MKYVQIIIHTNQIIHIVIYIILINVIIIIVYINTSIIEIHDQYKYKQKFEKKKSL